jgi:hypothetical protein
MLGRWSDFQSVEAIVHRLGGGTFTLDREFSQLQPDDRLRTSFEASYDRVMPSMTKADWQAVRDHTAVAYVLSPPITKGHALEVSGQALTLIAALLRSGGIAAKGESAGIAHGRDQWLELATTYGKAVQEGDWPSAASTLYWSWVRRPIVDNTKGVYYSCGMHLLGERDIEIEASLDLHHALDWMDLLGLYLVADRPARPIKDGEGFRLSAQGPRRILRMGPCQRYGEDDFFFNPYGYILLEPDAGE